MNLEQYGVEVQCELTPSGVLKVNLITNRALAVSVNDSPVNKGVTESRQHQQFWQANGTQSDTPPVNLRGL
jgi:hypothetical protein